MENIKCTVSPIAAGKYDVADDLRRITTIDARRNSFSRFEIDSIVYEIRREPWWGDYILVGPDGEIGRARKPGIFSGRLTMHFCQRELDLVPKGFSGVRFRMLEQGKAVGTIDRLGFWRTRGEADLPGDLPLPVLCFALWLAAVAWVRMENMPAIPINPS